MNTDEKNTPTYEGETGIWLGQRPGHTTGFNRYICSVCNQSNGKRKTPFCPHCGTRMVFESDDMNSIRSKSGECETALLDKIIRAVDVFFAENEFVTTPFGNQATSAGYSLNSISNLNGGNCHITLYAKDRAVREQDVLRGGDSVHLLYLKKENTITTYD